MSYVEKCMLRNVLCWDYLVAASLVPSEDVRMPRNEAATVLGLQCSMPLSQYESCINAIINTNVVVHALFITFLATNARVLAMATSAMVICWPTKKVRDWR